jgi:hypothetical protein
MGWGDGLGGGERRSFPAVTPALSRQPDKGLIERGSPLALCHLGWRIQRALYQVELPSELGQDSNLQPPDGGALA